MYMVVLGRWPVHAAIMPHGEEQQGPADRGDVPASQCRFARRLEPDAAPPRRDLAEVWKSLAGIGVPAEALATAQRDYISEAATIWNRLLMPAASRRRSATAASRAADWAANPSSAFLAEMYLLNARTLLRLAKSVEADAKTQARIRFAVLQWIDAAAPSNFLALNPEAQRKAIETNGESLAAGLQHLLDDIQQRPPVADRRERVRGRPQRRDDRRRGGLRERAVPALEYTPLTAKVHERPLLFVPPCINKFYILDLQPENSLDPPRGRRRATASSW